MKFFLWLDESGDFQEDHIQSKNPSLVGGILTRSGQLEKEEAARILKNAQQRIPGIPEKIHGNQIHGKKYGSFARLLLSDVVDMGVPLVVFDNYERAKIVNSDYTYLNIMAEGILQLCQTLSAEHPSLRLTVNIARRENNGLTEKQGYTSYIKDDEYITRLRERMDLAIIKRNLSRAAKDWEIDIVVDWVDRDPRLLISDVVTHSWLVRNSSKFAEEDRKEVIQLYREPYLYSIIENGTLAAVRKQVSEGYVGNALFEYLSSPVEEMYHGLHRYDEEYGDESISMDPTILSIVERLGQMSRFAQESQLGILADYLHTLLEEERDFVTAKLILARLEKDVIPLLAAKPHTIQAKGFIIKVHMLLLILATHIGDLELGEKQIKLLKEDINSFSNRWEALDIYFSILVREAVHLINFFNFEEAIEEMTSLENVIEELFITIASQGDITIVSDMIRADIKGKVLGTKLQALTFAGRSNRDYLHEARLYSNKAMEEFTNPDDLLRQYQYRAQLETEAGRFDEAFEWLARSVGKELGEEWPAGELLKAILAQPYGTVFGAMHYIRLAAEAAVNGRKELGHEMYDAWVKQQINEEHSMFRHLQEDHPSQIIWWKLGTLSALLGSGKAAQKHFERAIEICLKEKHRVTLRIIGLGIAIEKYATALEAGFKEEKKDYRKVMTIADSLIQEEMPQATKTFIQDLAAKFEELAQNRDAAGIARLSREIPY
ncbi:hypothetical protein [Mesobacillus jeotgali]|uniref:hypothetical protein n=1 Tax=Mesobacillus jeotgali TaxID=129985 RepID=UPI001CFE72DB|nr:hypothetical protein [Mesobacillus jeotgali]